MRIGVTGASGFLGRAITVEAADRGVHVLPISLPRDETVFNTETLTDVLRPLKLDAMIHAAAVRHPRSDADDRVNAEVPSLLRASLSALNPAVLFVHVSTLNVIDPARTDRYSRTKRDAERLLTMAPEIAATMIVRPGLLWSWSNDDGDAARLRRYLRWPLLVHPVPQPGQVLYPIPVQAFADRLLSLLIEDNVPPFVNATGDTAVSLFDLFAELARREGGNLMPVPISWLAPIFPKTAWPSLAMNLGLLAPRCFDQAAGEDADVWSFAFDPTGKN